MDENPTQTTLDEEATPARPRPIAASVGKRERVRLAKAELLMSLAVTAERWASEIEGTAEGVIPFAQWPDDDQRKTLCHTYGLSQADLVRITRGLAQEIENSSMRRGYEDVWR